MDLRLIRGRPQNVGAEVVQRRDRMAGAQPRRDWITSDEAFHLPAPPKRVAIMGGGYIAIEFAHTLSASTRS